MAVAVIVAVAVAVGVSVAVFAPVAVAAGGGVMSVGEPVSATGVLGGGVPSWQPAWQPAPLSSPTTLVAATMSVAPLIAIFDRVFMRRRLHLSRAAREARPS